VKYLRVVLAWLAAGAAAAQILPPDLGSRWWRSQQMIDKLELTADQRKKMDEVFQANRIKLIDLTAMLDKQEALLEPLVSADQPNADEIRAQINRVANARAELEKANANLLLGLRMLLTPNQWKILQTNRGPMPRKLTNGDESQPKPRKMGVLKEPAPGPSYWQLMVMPRSDGEAVIQTLKSHGFQAMLLVAPNQMVRVLVGPYFDPQALAQAKAELESSGFHPVQK
jgi:Spy/CpxP family protein refolding chaperone